MVTVKTPEEIKILREGGRRLAVILKAIVDEAKPGVSTEYLNTKAEEMIRAGGDIPSFLNHKSKGDSKPYPSSLCVSVNDEVVHGAPTANPQILKEGDIVGLDLGLIHKKLYTDHAVTVAVGKISKEAQQLLDVTKKSMAVGIKAAKAGRKTGDIGFAIQEYVKKYGYGIVRILAGHGVGYEVHEEPFVPNFGVKDQGVLLKAGMVIAIEPMLTIGSEELYVAKDGFTFITKDHSLAAHFEHTVVITDKGAEILTQV